MKIYIPFDYGYIGGPRTFLDNLKFYLDRKNVSFTTKVEEGDSTFFPNVIFDMDALKNIHNKGGKVVQRLDGVTYPSMHGANYEEKEHTKEIKDIYINYADFIVFQSEYSRIQCFEMYGEKEESNYEIIINGVNKEIFKPGKTSTKLDGKIKFVTSANFRKADLIEPIVEALDKLKGKFDFELHTVGGITNPDLKKFFERDYIIHHDNVNMQGVAEILQTSDIFLFSNINPPCPNSVCEAVSTALPVVSFDSGSMKELCSFSTELLTPVSNDIFQKYEDFNFDKFAEKIQLCIDQFPNFKQKALDNAYKYSFEECGSKYVSVFERVIGKDIYKSSFISNIKRFFNN